MVRLEGFRLREHNPSKAGAATNESSAKTAAEGTVSSNNFTQQRQKALRSAGLPSRGHRNVGLAHTCRKADILASEGAMFSRSRLPGSTNAQAIALAEDR